jgi:hypothetical protein
VKLALAVVAVLALCLCGCGNGLQTKDAVKSGVIKGVAKRGVNVDAMDVDISNVTFRGDQADATVVFIPKGGRPETGLTMHYTLQRHDQDWVIVGRGQMDLKAHTGVAGDAAPQSVPQRMSPSPIPDLPPALPAGHPPVSGTPQ